MRRRAEIDGLRALAVGPILLFHAGAPGFSGGFVGVDVFYVISGFLIAGLIGPDAVAGRLDLLEFWTRRARRLFPALAVVIAVCLAAGALVMTPRDLAALGRAAAAAALFSSNILFWKEAGYFDAAAALKPLLHTWSLGVEEQFYLGFPLVMIGLARLMGKGLWRGVAALALLSFLLSAVLTPLKPAPAFYLLPTRAFELLIGATLALRPPPEPGPRLAEFLALIGLALLVVAVVGFSEATPFPGFAALVPCAAAALLIQAGGRARLTGALLRSPPLVATGLISYSLYLWHWPLLAFPRYLLGALSAPLAAGLVAATFATAALSWAFIEEPVRRGRLLAGRRALWTATGTALAVLAALGLALHLFQGLPGRFAPRVLALAAAADDHPPQSLCADAAPSAIAAGRVCVIGAVGVRPDVLVWGDSHAWALQGVLGQALARAGRSGLLVSRNGCPPLLGLRRVAYAGPCMKVGWAVMTRLQGGDIRTLVLVSTWTGYFDKARLVDAESARPSAQETGRAVGRRLMATARKVHAAGVDLVLMEPLPGARVDAPRALALKAAFGFGPPVELTRRRFLTLNRPWFDAADAAQAQGLVKARVRLWPALCGAGPRPGAQEAACAAALGGRPLLIDDAHPAAHSFGFAVGPFAAALSRPEAPPEAPHADQPSARPAGL